MIGALLTQNQICCDEKIFLIYCHVNTFDVYLMCGYGGILPNSKRKTSSSSARSKSVRAEKRVNPHSSQKRGKKKLESEISSSPKKRTSRKKKNSGASPKRDSTAKRKKRSASKRNKPSILGQLSALALGLIFGCGTCVFLMYQQAVDDVSSWLNPMVIAPPQQKIYTAPLQFSQEQHLEQKEVEDFLLDAGYLSVASDPNGGAFVSKKGQIVLRNDAGVLHQISFANGKIKEIQKKGKTVRVMRTQPIPLYTIKTEERERRKTPIQEIPLVMQQGVVAVEDSRFYEHEGVDIIGVLRAIVINVVSQSKSQGASTLTQQIVKNLILHDSKKTYKRKVRELLRAVALEQTLQTSLARSIDPKQALKERILEIYLNEVYLGHVNGKEVRGVSEGAQVFFGKPIQKISLGEAATLAGIISSPNGYSPVRHRERAQERRDIALLRMTKMNFISQAEKDAVQKVPLAVNYRPKYKRAPWFVDYMLSRIDTEKIAQSDIPTALDPVLQLQAEKAVQIGLQDLVKKYPQAKGANAALVVLHNSDASIAAMVGGKDYRSSSYNRAVYAKRQVGSIAKPFWSALAMNTDQTLLPGCWLKDEKLTLGSGKHTWTPKNYDRKYLGAISLRAALATSRNIPFVHLYQGLENQKGIEWVQAQFSRLGLEVPPYPSSALGSFSAAPIDMARAFTLFSNGGLLPKGQRWISSTTSSLVTDMMRTVMTEGTGKSIEKYAAERYLYGKSGTTDGGRDAWFVGFDKDYTIAVWVGFDKEVSLGLGGATAALPIFGHFVQRGGLGQDELKSNVALEYKSFCFDAPDCLQTEPDLVPRGASFDSRCTYRGMEIFAEEEKQGFWSSIFSF